MVHFKSSDIRISRHGLCELGVGVEYLSFGLYAQDITFLCINAHTLTFDPFFWANNIYFVLMFLYSRQSSPAKLYHNRFYCIWQIISNIEHVEEKGLKYGSFGNSCVDCNFFKVLSINDSFHLSLSKKHFKSFIQWSFQTTFLLL